MKIGENVEFCPDCPARGTFVGSVTDDSVEVIEYPALAACKLQIEFRDNDRFSSDAVTTDTLLIDEKNYGPGEPQAPPDELMLEVGKKAGSAIVGRIAKCNRVGAKICPAFNRQVLLNFARDAYQELSTGESTPE